MLAQSTRGGLLLSTLAFLSAPASAQTASCPDPVRLTAGVQGPLAHVRYLADDALQGREVGTWGADCAADYIAATFRELGLEPAGIAGSWFQPFPVPKGAAMGPDNRLAISDKVYAPGKDWIPMGFSASTELGGTLAYGGHGLSRPGNPDDLLQISRRTRLILRLPVERLGDARALTGRALDVAGHRLTVGEASERPLSNLTTIFARYIVAGEAESEEGFLKAMHTALHVMGITPKKMLCGIEHRLRTPDGPLRTRSLMVAELSPDESRRLQEQGLGSFRHLGCGLLLPHKGIQELHPVLE